MHFVAGFCSTWNRRFSKKGRNAHFFKHEARSLFFSTSLKPTKRAKKKCIKKGCGENIFKNVEKTSTAVTPIDFFSKCQGFLVTTRKKKLDHFLI